MSSFKYGVVTPTILTEERTDFPTANDNISIPIGTIGFVKEYVDKLGLGPVFSEIKRKGTPLLLLVNSLIAYRLTENFSVEGCGRWLENDIIRNEFGIGKEVSHRMLNRAVEDIGKNMEEVISKATFSIRRGYDLPHTDCNLDSSSLSVYSKQSSLFSFGYSRDKRPDLRQVNFAVAVERKRNAMSFELNKCGKIIILTTSDDDALDILVRYRLRNEAEKLFETLKDELEGGVNYLSSHNSVSGMIFAEFVLVSLRYVLAERLREAELPGKVWIPDVLGLMNKLKITYLNGKWRLNEVSKKQREMYSALGVPIPELGDHLNLKPCHN
ncbi:hypothetical protein SDC9_63231 [bioreactor metagenome]|uniref:Transposase IS4-like domain-containing protein n=1 Tax=bioreactor metagenome TaxID=1076179 RepID=A0A644XL74_9ZZZZ